MNYTTSFQSDKLPIKKADTFVSTFWGTVQNRAIYKLRREWDVLRWFLKNLTFLVIIN